MPKTYTFHVSLPGTGRAWRKIEMLACPKVIESVGNGKVINHGP